MKVLVTGATGKVGNAIAARPARPRRRGAGAGPRPEARRELLPAGVEPIRATSPTPTAWPPRSRAASWSSTRWACPSSGSRTRGSSTASTPSAAATWPRRARGRGVSRFVHTSTHDVFHADQRRSVRRDEVADYPKGTAYERSKQHAEELVLAERDGMEVVILNPAGVYGPGPSPTASFENGPVRAAGARRGSRPLPPGGIGHAYVDGVAAGHLLAAERGKPTASATSSPTPTRASASWPRRVREVAGRGRVPPMMPVPLAKAFAADGEGVSRVIRRPPMLPKGQLTYLLWQARPDSSKAQRELGWRPRRSRTASAGPSRPWACSKSCLAEAADPGHEAADPGRVVPELVTVGADQVGLLDGAPGSPARCPVTTTATSRARSGPAGRSRPRR